MLARHHVNPTLNQFAPILIVLSRYKIALEFVCAERLLLAVIGQSSPRRALISRMQTLAQLKFN